MPGKIDTLIIKVSYLRVVILLMVTSFLSLRLKVLVTIWVSPWAGVTSGRCHLCR